MEDEAREGVRGPRGGEREAADMDPESRPHLGAQPRQPQLLSRTQSVRRYGELTAEVH